MNEFLILLSEVVFEEAPKKPLTKDTKFKDLDEWDSLTLLMLIAEVDSKYSMKLTEEVIKKCETIEDLYQKCQSKS